VAIPWLQRRITNISPTIIFIVLSTLFAGVILHAKFDYSLPAPPAAVSDAAAPPPAAPDAVAATGFFFEEVNASHDASSTLAQPIALSLLLAIALLIVARAMVLQTRQRRFSPRMVYILISLLVLAAYLAWDNSHMPPSLAVTPVSPPVPAAAAAAAAPVPIDAAMPVDAPAEVPADAASQPDARPPAKEGT
jgi:hypothetical protein